MEPEREAGQERRQAVPPPRRNYERSWQEKLRDFDASERARRMQMVTWMSAVTFLWLLVGVAAVAGGVARGWLLLLIASLGPLMYAVVFALVGDSGALVGRIYQPSAASTPRGAEYSKARALLMQGQYEAAAAAYEAHCLENPANPEPYLALIRIHRVRLKNPAAAVEWGLRMLSQASPSVGQAILARQGIAEILIRDLQDPRKALPHLAYLALHHADTSAGRGAERDLAVVREMLAREQEGLGPCLDRARLLDGAGPASATDPRRLAVLEALEASHGDRVGAATRLGVTVARMEQLMEQLEIGPGDPTEARDAQ